jgi:hypothetical protein
VLLHPFGCTRVGLLPPGANQIAVNNNNNNNNNMFFGCMEFIVVSQHIQSTTTRQAYVKLRNAMKYSEIMQLMRRDGCLNVAACIRG